MALPDINTVSTEESSSFSSRLITFAISVNAWELVCDAL